ncbi:hypothetical protein CN168_34275, partial [Sinorhizobium medicae]
NGSRQRHSSPSSLASGSSTDETGPPHRIPDSPGFPVAGSVAGTGRTARAALVAKYIFIPCGASWRHAQP